MDIKFVVVSDAEFEQLGRLGDYKPSGSTLERIEGDVAFYVFPRSVWDWYQRITVEVEAECADLARPVVSYSQFGGESFWP
jgi:hypothetical protein